MSNDTPDKKLQEKQQTSRFSRRNMLLTGSSILAAAGLQSAGPVTTAQAHSAPGRPKLALALQGGGSQGAFTWGVLDRLLEDATINIVGVTGTSAGAMNGAVLVDGLVRGGPKQARAELQRYWEAVGGMPGFGSFFSGISGEQAANTPLESIPAYVEGMKKQLSPYDLPQSNDNPMRPLLAEMIDFDRLRLQEEIQLTVCATNARTARRHVFTNRDISVDALLASACLPQLFRAVEIDGEPYWDGALTGNPALGPLLTKMHGLRSNYRQSRSRQSSGSAPHRARHLQPHSGNQPQFDVLARNRRHCRFVAFRR